MLYLIGLGVGDEGDIPEKGIDACRTSSQVFAELYTACWQGSLHTLEKKIGKGIKVLERKDLEIALKAEQQSYRQHLTDVSDDFHKQVAMTQVKLKELEKRLKSVEKKPPPSAEKPAAPAAPPAPSPPPEKSVPSEKPAPPVEVPPTGKIIEQDIQ